MIKIQELLDYAFKDRYSLRSTESYQQSIDNLLFESSLSNNTHMKYTIEYVYDSIDGKTNLLNKVNDIIRPYISEGYIIDVHYDYYDTYINTLPYAKVICTLSFTWDKPKKQSRTKTINLD